MAQASYYPSFSYLSATVGNTAGTLVEKVDNPVPEADFASGTGNNEINQVWSTSGTLTATTLTLNLQALTAPTGTISFSKVKFLVIRNKNTTSGQILSVGAATSNPWVANLTTGGTTAVFALDAGDLWEVIVPLAGMAVSGTNKSLKLDAGASTIAYEIYVMGLS